MRNVSIALVSLSMGNGVRSDCTRVIKRYINHKNVLTSLDLTQAPTPFLMGGHSSWVKDLPFGSESEEEIPLVVNDDSDVEENKPGFFVKIDIDADKIIDPLPEKNSAWALKFPGRDDLINNLRNSLFPSLEKIDSIVPSKTQNLKNNIFEFTEESEEMVRHLFMAWFVGVFHEMRQYYRMDGRFDERKWFDALQENDKPFFAVNFY